MIYTAMKAIDISERSAPRDGMMNNDATEMEPAKSSLVDLGTDILTMIVDLLSVHDARSFGLLNSTLYKIGKYSTRRHLSLDTSSDGFAATQRRLVDIRDGELCTAVRSVTLVRDTERLCTAEQRHYPRPLEARKSSLVDLFCDLLPRMTGLREVRWPGNDVPEAVLKTLQSCTDVRLYASLPGSTICGPDAGLLRLRNNPNLYSLDVKCQYTSAEECLVATGPLKEVLLTCPNIRELTLNFGMPTGGCVIHSPPAEYCGLGLRHGEKPPALESLDVVRYPFGHGIESTITPSGHCYFAGYHEDESEEDYWVESFDWSSLRKLKSPSAGFALKLMPKLTSLREITFHSSWDNEKAVRFFLEVPAHLEAITVESIESITHEGLLRHGSSLRKLQIHQVENRRFAWHKEAMSYASVQKIAEGCPHLEELALDINRYKTWPGGTFDTLASFPRLHTLTIWFELGINEPNEPLEPYVTFSTATMLFPYLHARNPKLRKLKVHAGSPPGIGFGYPTTQAYWPLYNSSSFSCELSDRDDEAARGIFKTTCLSVDERGNEWLRARREQTRHEEIDPGRELKALRDGWDASDVGNELEAVKVAWLGPTPQNLWDGHY